ncbi:uncharacterized protein VTP21DRAFT_2345 [Calcarisporiella thermophila]|uniref:uncharacterized protein n=1 Tax=Calcarisporiella thermophila TaxID=911321 RepID=UPI003743D7E8
MKPYIISLSVVIALASIAQAAPSKRGYYDDSIDNVDVLNDIDVLDTNINSDTTDIRNRNYKSHGHHHHSPANKRGYYDDSIDNVDVLNDIDVLNTNINSDTTDVRNRNYNSKSHGHHHHSAANKRGYYDGSIDNVDVLNDIDVLDTNINSDTTEVRNRNSNSKSHGHHHHSAANKRGYYDDSIDNVDVLNDIDVLNTNINSDTTDVRNRNFNSKPHGHHHHLAATKRGFIDDSVSNVDIANEISALNTNINSDTTNVENRNINGKSHGHHHHHSAANKRGWFSNSGNNADIFDHLSFFNTNFNSEIESFENRNANTRARGDYDNTIIHWRDKRGFIDDSVSNVDVANELSLLNTNINSDTTDVQNRNFNTKHGHHHHHHRATDKRGFVDDSISNVDVANEFSILNSNINSDSTKVHNRNMNSKSHGHHKRGLLDGSLNNADILSHISLFDSTQNSDVSISENRNANTHAHGDYDNSIVHWKDKRGFIDDSVSNVDVANEFSILNTNINSDTTDVQNRNYNSHGHHHHHHSAKRQYIDDSVGNVDVANDFGLLNTNINSDTYIVENRNYHGKHGGHCKGKHHHKRTSDC